MKQAIAKLSFAALALTGGALTSCVVPAGYYGPGGPGPGYNGGGYQQSGGSYVQDAEYGGQPDDGGPEFIEEGGAGFEVLPVGAVYVFEGGERHWYYHGHCYRRGPHGYVTIRRNPHHTTVHHDAPKVIHRDDHHDDHRVIQHNESEHHEPQHIEHRETEHVLHHEETFMKNGKKYKKLADGRVVEVK